MPILIDKEKLLNNRVYSVKNGRFPYKKAYENLLHDIQTATAIDTERVSSGVFDKNGVEMRIGDKVNGIFYLDRAVQGIVDFDNGAFGLTWSRGEISEFSPFCSMCNVEYEVVK